MKKLFTTLLVLVILMTSMSVNAQEQETPEDQSYLTIERIENSFWEVLESCKFPKMTKEDEFIAYIIEEIREPKVITGFYDLKVISIRIKNIPDKDVDIDRLVLKCQLIVELYNHYHDLQLTVEKKKFTYSTTDIFIKSEIPDFIKDMVAMTGQLAHVKEGTIYWESSEKYGSGKSGKIKETCVVKVNGVAYLDKNGNVVFSYYGKKIQPIRKTMMTMVHICVK